MTERPGDESASEGIQNPKDPKGFKESFSRARIHRQRIEERDVIVKDFGSGSYLFRRWIGPYLLDREERAYRALAGVPGIPRAVRRLSREALAIEHIAGEVVGKASAGALGREFFARLDETVHEMHRRGVVHLDLQQKRNILVGPGGRPYLVDFASSFLLDRGWIRQHLLLPLLARVDRMAILKFMGKYAPELLDDASRASLRRQRFVARLWPFRYLNELKKVVSRKRRGS